MAEARPGRGPGSLNIVAENGTGPASRHGAENRFRRWIGVCHGTIVRDSGECDLCHSESAQHWRMSWDNAENPV